VSEKHVIKFYHIAQFFGQDMNYLSRGENAYTSGHVQSVTFDGNVEPVLLNGVVQASMKKRAYNVEVRYFIKLVFRQLQFFCAQQ
jgi:hypothetical protein